MYKKLISFDFDGTLCHTPNPEIGRPQWEKATGYQWKGRGWWGNPESLNLNIFYPPINQWVYAHYLEYVSNPDNYVFIATGRLKKLENHVKKVLNLHDLKSDLFCNTGGETFRFKCYLFESLINVNPKAEELILFDDRHEHLVKFKEWAKLQPIKVTIIDVINKKWMTT